MPVYDCGDPDCTECQSAFGPDRSKAIARFRAREAAYAEPNAHVAEPFRSILNSFAAPAR